MSNLLKAADDARRLLRGFSALADVAAALEQVGQLEQRSTEATAILAGLQVQVADAQAALVTAKADASQHWAKAKQQAADTIAKAEVKVSDILGSAERAAKAVETTANELVSARQAEAVSAMAARDSALVKRDTLAKECEALEARLAKAQTAINKLLKD